MLNCTGGGTIEAMNQGYVLKKADLILSPELPEEVIISKVNKLFDN